MSIESAKACMERIKTDEDFAKEVMECKDAEARMAFVRAAGYDFTREEVSPLLGEMRDDELDAVAGGAGLRPPGDWPCWKLMG
jgi:predicted ribosomally synthesized peptide with nif11-like leader